MHAEERARTASLDAEVMVILTEAKAGREGEPVVLECVLEIWSTVMYRMPEVVMSCIRASEAPGPLTLQEVNLACSCSHARSACSVRYWVVSHLCLVQGYRLCKSRYVLRRVGLVARMQHVGFCWTDDSVYESTQYLILDMAYTLQMNYVRLPDHYHRP